jgi:hypothetical protein
MRRTESNPQCRARLLAAAGSAAQICARLHHAFDGTFIEDVLIQSWPALKIAVRPTSATVQ